MRWINRLACVLVCVALGESGLSYGAVPAGAGAPVSREELRAVLGLNTTHNCVFAGKVCGFGFSTGGPDTPDDGCTQDGTTNDCSGTWDATLFQCVEGFWNQYKCNGPNLQPTCDSTNSSKNCGQTSHCTLPQYTCSGGTCTLTGMALCVTDEHMECGSFGSCMAH